MVEESAPSLVKQINAIYHDVEAQFYNARHPEIFDYEQEELLGMARLVVERLSGFDTVTCIDFGTGTGFIPEFFAKTLMGYEKPSFRWVLCDISLTMLQVARERLKNRGCQVLGCVVMDAERPAFKAGSADVITVNSVLHHLPAPQEFVRECLGLLHYGGLLVISHEPKLGYYRSFLWHVVKGVQYVYSRLKYLRTALQPRQQVGNSRNALFWEQVESKLGAAKITHLSREQVQKLVDFHSPTAGGSLGPNRGLDALHLVSGGWEIVQTHTYAHLGKLALKQPKHSLLRRIDKVLRVVFPRAGSLFWVVARKAQQ